MKSKEPIALNGNTIVKIDPNYENTLDNGLIIPATTKEPKVKYGTVISVSPDKDYGAKFGPGDVVAVATFHADDMENGYHILSTANVLAVVEVRTAVED